MVSLNIEPKGARDSLPRAAAPGQGEFTLRACASGLERIEMAAGRAVHAAEEAAGGAQDAAAFAEEPAAAASDGASTI